MNIPGHWHACREKHKQAIEEWVAIQYIFDCQWLALKVRGTAEGMPVMCIICSLTQVRGAWELPGSCRGAALTGPRFQGLWHFYFYL